MQESLPNSNLLLRCLCKSIRADRDETFAPPTHHQSSVKSKWERNVTPTPHGAWRWPLGPNLQFYPLVIKGSETFAASLQIEYFRWKFERRFCRLQRKGGKRHTQFATKQEYLLNCLGHRQDALVFLSWFTKLLLWDLCQLQF